MAAMEGGVLVPAEQLKGKDNVFLCVCVYSLAD